MKNILTRAGLSLGLLAGISLTAEARVQQQTTEQQQSDAEAGRKQHRRHMGRKGGRGPMGGHGRMGGDGRLLEALNLTEEQRARIRQIRETNAEASRTRRQELRQIFEQRRAGGAEQQQSLTPEQESRARALMNELREASKRTHDEMLATLTPEQRTQLEQAREQRKAERRARREQFRQRRQERQDNEQ